MTDIVYNKNGVPFDIDAIATDVNGKMDKDGVNATCPVVVSHTPNSQGGVVEIWSDGYCVQTGFQAGTLEGNFFRITLPQAYKNSSITTTLMATLNSTDLGFYEPRLINTRENNSFAYFMFLGGSVTTNNPTVRWRTEGYIR